MALMVSRLGPAALELEATGILDRADYDYFVPLAERCIKDEGKVDLLIRVVRFRGWSPPAMWQNLKFDALHYNDVTRLALVGNGCIDRLMARASTAFTAGEVRFFKDRDIDQARAWITVPA